ncbi:MAG: DUF2336 domain-containing protein [bacterium]|nr:DUF2336 domain-containing protein [bacterium]MDY2829808.1 DUF2336 domain-containing protein [Alphaproteobacteria bacterium]
MNTGSLNRQDVAALANHATVETKSTIARKVSACYDTGQISQKAAKLAEDIFRIMVRDTEIKVREVLSDSLKHCKDLPKDVVNSILNDKDSIAVPFLQYYASLTKEDLVRILNISNLPRQKAVAKRHGLPAEISDYITDRCETEVVGELLSNNTADIYEKTYLKITDKYASNEDIKKRLVYRSVLPTSVIEKIVDKLSYKLKTYLMLHHNLSDDLASNLVEDVKEKMTLSISEEYSSDAQIEELVHQLYKANRLTPGLVIRAICLGDLKFFEYAIVYLSETPIAEVRKILFNPQADFMVRNLLRKALIPKGIFPAIFNALQIIREIRFDCGRSDKKIFGHKVVERILSFAQSTDELSTDDITYLLSKIN